MTDWADEIAETLESEMGWDWEVDVNKLATTLRKARSDALEEAAELLEVRSFETAANEAFAQTNAMSHIAACVACACADAIRALKDKP
jgi:hypothetical protein